MHAFGIAAFYILNALSNSFFEAGAEMVKSAGLTVAEYINCKNTNRHYKLLCVIEHAKGI
ncbi:hypothetical protein GCM10011325_18580 [Dyadobacter sediminis]|nr:hypothetical protein GCM10011325_18580 [Dyadobacter sediminis]